MPESSGWRTPWQRDPSRGDHAARAVQLEHRVRVLERERSDLRRILGSLGEGVLAVDRSGVVLHANRVAIELLDLDPDACVGSHLYVAVPEPAACEALEEVMRGGDDTGPASRELVLDRRAGELVVRIFVRPLRGGDGHESEPEGAIAVVRDVTEVRRLERARQDFFTNVSHELKTPVTAIRGALETIVDDPAMDEPTRTRFLDGAVQHALRLGALVTDLLALSRLESDPGALQREPVDVATVATDVVSGAAADARRRGIEVVTELAAIDAPPPVVEADEEAIRQAVSNLVDNAVAHSHEGGTVRVRVVRDPDAGVVELAVVDEGVGIPEHAVERIFERFYRVDAGRSRARGGTGIGLSIVKHVAQACGGSIAVASVEGAGSTFTLRLPVSQSPDRGIHQA